VPDIAAPSLERDQEKPATAPAPVRISKYDEEFLEKLHQLIERNLSNENYSIELLASDICLSRTQLFRKCKALTGASPVELLRNTRLDAARQLLAEGKGSVAEVASLVGFADASYFTRCYKAYFGTTPHEMNRQKY
jgi:AraC-like DNA-binding protein